MKFKIYSLFFIAVFFITSSLFAQDTGTEEPVRYQFVQQFKWKPSDKAFKYEINIESFENGTWVPEMEPVQTKETTITLSLYPGRKRISITSMNRLGRRGKSTEWVEFKVLDETQPYLYDDYLKKSIQWESPVLRITHADSDDTSDQIASENGDPEHSFFLKGKNIFLTETRFYMNPIDTPLSGGRDFEAYNKLRRTVSLKIVRRDFDRPGVVVEYDPSLLDSGYYEIVAENPGNQKTSLEILVLANKAPEFDEKQFAFYPNYEVRLLDKDTILQHDNKLIIAGSGFSGDTRFALTPSSSGIPYPFVTSKERTKLDLNVSEIKTLTQNGYSELSFKVNPDDIPPGYYILSAENSMGKSSVLLLVRNVDMECLNPSIESAVVSKGKKNTVNLNLKGLNLSSEHTYTLVSQLSQFTGLNTRIPLNVIEQDKKGKKITLNCSNEKVAEGTYAILAESPETTAVKFITIDEKIKSKIAFLSEKEVKDLFLRPENFIASVSGDDISEGETEELVYNPFEFKTVKKYRVLFPYLELDFGIANNYWAMESFAPEKIFSAGFGFELINLDAVHLGFAGSWNINENFYSVEAFLRFSTTNSGLRPYLGAGVGFNVFDLKNETPITLIKDIFKDNVTGTYPYGIYAFADVGVVLFDFLDVRYTMHYSGVDRLIGVKGFSNNDYYETGNYFYDDVTVAARVPLGKMKRIQKPINQALTITKNGPVNGADYKIRKDTKKIIFSNGVTEISGFNDNYMLTSLSIPDTVKVIGKDAFKNCYNLKEVILPDGVVEIAEGAFEGCRSMQKITLPSSIRKVSPLAFSDWQEFQNIVYTWTKDDTTKRDLGGLENQKNFTTVYDAIRTPFEKRDVFTGYSSPSMKYSVQNTRHIIDGEKYYGVLLNASFYKRNGNEHWAGMDTRDPVVMKYLMNGDGIKFKYIGDGKWYRIEIKSRNEETNFYYEFYAKNGENEITIPYRYFVYDQYSSKRYVKMKKMDAGIFRIAALIDYDAINVKEYFKLNVFGFETIMEKKKK